MQFKNAASEKSGNSQSVFTGDILTKPHTNTTPTQNAEISVVPPVQSKFIKSADTPILSMNPESDPDLTTYLNKQLRTNKPEPQNNMFWFLTPKILAKLTILPQEKNESSENYTN